MTIAEGKGSGNQFGTARVESKKPRLRGLKSGVERHGMLLIAIVLLSSSASFGLGMLAGRESGAGEPGGDFWVEDLRQADAASTTPEVADRTDEVVVPLERQTASVGAVVPASGGAYVASKSGTKYYLPWCGTVSRIKEENKVWFGTKQEAEQAGYEPAKNCKGL